MQPVAHLDDLPEGTMRMVRVHDRRVCLVRTASGVHALDNACPHEGYGLTQGSLDGELLTCQWHNWKYRVSDGRCVQGEEDVTTHPVTIGPDGAITVELSQPDPEARRPQLIASLRSGIQRDYVGQISRDVVRLLRASADPGELIWEAVQYGAPRAEFGWGHAVASATDCLSMVDLYEGDARALPIVQAIAGIADEERNRPERSLPAPARAVPGDGAASFRMLVEREDIAGAQALVLGALERGDGPDDLLPWFTGAVSDHHLGYGHGAIYTQKAFQLLALIGWDRASTVLPHLVPTLVYMTREDLLPYMRPFMKALGTVDLGGLADAGTVPGWADDGTLRHALLGSDRTAALQASVAALRAGAGVGGLLDAVVDTVSTRLLRYDDRNEFVFEDDFGWLDITHGLTYANAARWHHDRNAGPETVRLALFTAFLAQWTGRHEWHTEVAPALEPEDGQLLAACAELRPAAAVGAALSTPVDAAACELQQAALLDRTTAFIVHAHAVKTSRAAADEARASGSSLPLAATARFMAAPKLERFVAATVTRSIDFLSGRVERD